MVYLKTCIPRLIEINLKFFKGSTFMLCFCLPETPFTRYRIHLVTTLILASYFVIIFTLTIFSMISCKLLNSVILS